jgi:hypothetical protein
MALSPGNAADPAEDPVAHALAHQGFRNHVAKITPGVTKRSCGKCSLCCRLMGVPEVKVDHEWCPHARAGQKAGGYGCSIYPRRPERCWDWHCQWLVDPRFGQHWYPLKSRIIVDVKIENGKPFVMFVVDPDYPNRWREEPWFSDIKTVARAGLDGRLGKPWTTVIVLKDKRIPIIK